MFVIVIYMLLLVLNHLTTEIHCDLDETGGESDNPAVIGQTLPPEPPQRCLKVPVFVNLQPNHKYKYIAWTQPHLTGG